VIGSGGINYIKYMDYIFNENENKNKIKNNKVKYK